MTIPEVADDKKRIIHEGKDIKTGDNISYDNRCNGDGESMQKSGDFGKTDSDSTGNFCGLRTCLVRSVRSEGRTAGIDGEGRPGNGSGCGMYASLTEWKIFHII